MSAPAADPEAPERPVNWAVERRIVKAWAHLQTPKSEREARKVIDAVLCPRCSTSRLPRARACSCPRELPR